VRLIALEKESRDHGITIQANQNNLKIIYFLLVILDVLKKELWKKNTDTLIKKDN